MNKGGEKVSRFYKILLSSVFFRLAGFVQNVVGSDQTAAIIPSPDETADAFLASIGGEKTELFFMTLCIAGAALVISMIFAIIVNNRKKR